MPLFERGVSAKFTIFLLHMYWFGMIIKIGTYYRLCAARCGAGCLLVESLFEWSMPPHM